MINCRCAVIEIPREGEAYIIESDGTKRKVQASWTHGKQQSGLMHNYFVRAAVKVINEPS